MLFIISDNFKNENGYDDMIQFLKNWGLDYQIVRTIPFTDIIVPEGTYVGALDPYAADAPRVQFDMDQQIWCMGSYGLVKRAKKLGWQPGGYLDGLAYDQAWNWSWENYFNSHPEFTTLGQLPTIKSDKFIRPIADSKVFGGEVFTPERWRAFHDFFRTENLDNPVNRYTKIVVAEPKKITSETRLFIVKNRIVTGSQYTTNGKFRPIPYIDPQVREFAEHVLTLWQPNPAYVLDIAVGEEGPKILETNCLNCAGFYASDVFALMRAICHDILGL